MRRLSRWLGFGFWALILLFPKDSNTQPLYYKGKTIAVIEGRSPGGVGDLRTKAILPFLQSRIAEAESRAGEDAGDDFGRPATATHS